MRNLDLIVCLFIRKMLFFHEYYLISCYRTHEQTSYMGKLNFTNDSVSLILRRNDLYAILKRVVAKKYRMYCIHDVRDSNNQE